MKILAAILAFVFGWISMWAILLDKKHKYRHQLADLWGWDDPAMQVHWDRWRRGDPGDPFPHRTKNLAAEWNEILSQRGYKVMCWIGGNLFIIGLIIGAVAAWVI